MEKKGKVIQIIKNKDLNKYMFTGWIIDLTIKTKNDLVVLRNLEYPNGLKGYFLSFKKNKPEDAFPILMNSNGIKNGDILKINCEKFYVPTDFYIKIDKGKNEKK